MGFLDFLAGMSNSSSGADELYIGDLVYIIPHSCNGTIIGMHGDKYLVEVEDYEPSEGKFSDYFTRSQLKKVW